MKKKSKKIERVLPFQSAFLKLLGDKRVTKIIILKGRIT